MKTRKWTLAACIGLLAALPAGATTLAPMNLRQLTAAASIVVRAKCLGGASRWQNGEIWTFTRFASLESFKGSPPAEFTVSVLGGRVGAIESVVDGTPRFHAGEEVVLFLEPAPAGGYGITAWIEGTFRVQRDAAGRAWLRQASAGQVVFDRATRGFRMEGIGPMPLAAFRERMRLLLARKPVAPGTAR
jgi:hypothetical protein